MADIKRLLNKKGWTGRELGILELTNMAVQFRQALSGEEQKPIVDKGQFSKMLSTIKDSTQGAIYNGYISIHEWLSIRYNIAQTQLQQAQLQYRTLAQYLTDAILAEDVYSYIEQLPAIMTEKQYKDAVEAGRHKWLYGDGEEREERADSLPALIERGILYYTQQLQKNPAKPNPLKAIRKKYINQPVKSKLILEGYNEVMGEGYYTLQDGRRSDQMTDEEWRAAITTPTMQKALTEMQAEDGSGQELTKQIAQQRIINRARVIFNGGTEQDADEAQHKKDYELGLAVPCEWHYYDEPPEGLTKWDIIETGLWEFYGLLFCGMEGSKEEYQEELQDFLSEFKDAVDVIIADLEKNYFTGKEPLQPLPTKGEAPFTSIASTPLENWGETVFSWEDLYKHNVYGFKDEAEADTAVFDGNYRAVFNGIAIIRASDLLDRSPRIDENGYYVEPNISHRLSNFTLEAFFPEAEDYADNVEIVEDARQVLEASYYHLKGYNLALDMIARYYDVPELTVFKMPIDGIEDKIEAFNNLVPLLYKRIKDLHYGDKELKERKLQVLKDLFQPIDYEALTIPADNREKAEQLLEGFKAFKPEHTAQFDNLLCTLPETENENGEGAY